jgi:hypothetical protein
VTHRRFGCFVLLVAVLFFAPVAAESQVPNKTYRIGWVGSRDDRWEAFQRALGERGWVEGRHFVADIRKPARGRRESLEQVTEELVQAKVDVIVGFGTAYALAAQRATRPSRSSW